MELQHIALSNLEIATVNVRHTRKPPDVSDILSSVRARGILQPLLVRPNGKGFEIVAGRRRYFAALQVAAEQTADTTEVMLPCAVMATGDDAAAMEASLIENVARAAMDEMEQYEAFARLLKEGRAVAEIADIFGVSELTVRRRLALANLHPKIRDAYRRDEIEQDDLKLLTLASKRQQKEWLAAFAAESDPDNEETEGAPRGRFLKQWLCGGEQVATTAALFPVADYKGDLITDLFGEITCFADRDAFWGLQNAAIAKLRDELVAKGWTEVVVLERGHRFHTWQYVSIPLPDGGKVFIEVRDDGEVDIHEGYLLEQEFRRAQRRTRPNLEGEAGDETAPSPKLELTKAAENYLALHRHAVVRAALLNHQGVALRLAVAHMIAGSPLWSIKPEAQRAEKEVIAESLRTGAAQIAFEQERTAILNLLDLEPSFTGMLVRPNGDPFWTATVFARLLALSDGDVLRVLAFAMGETLAAGSPLVEATGIVIKPDVAAVWRADEVFLDLIRDRAAVNGMLTEVAGKAVADANVSETAKAQKKIIGDCLTGEGRVKVEAYVPRYMAFPIRSYGDGKTFKLLDGWLAIAPLFDGM